MKNEIKEEFKKARPIPGSILSMFEIEDPHTPGEYHIFDIAMSDNYLFVGSMCNAGMAYMAHMERDNDFSLDENIQELYDAIYHKVLYGEEVSGDLY